MNLAVSCITQKMELQKTTTVKTNTEMEMYIENNMKI